MIEIIKFDIEKQQSLNKKDETKILIQKYMTRQIVTFKILGSCCFSKIIK